MRVKSSSIFGGIMHLSDDLLSEIAEYCGVTKVEAKRRLHNGEDLVNTYTGTKYTKVNEA